MFKQIKAYYVARKRQAALKAVAKRVDKAFEGVPNSYRAEVYNVLCDIRQNAKLGQYKDRGENGICSLSEILLKEKGYFGTYVYSIYPKLYDGWRWHSGNPGWPVERDGKHYWLDKNLELRLSLLDYMIESIELADIYAYEVKR